MVYVTCYPADLILYTPREGRRLAPHSIYVYIRCEKWAWQQFCGALRAPLGRSTPILWILQPPLKSTCIIDVWFIKLNKGTFLLIGKVKNNETGYMALMQLSLISMAIQLWLTCSLLTDLIFVTGGILSSWYLIIWNLKWSMHWNYLISVPFKVALASIGKLETLMPSTPERVLSPPERVLSQELPFSSQFCNYYT